MAEETDLSRTEPASPQRLLAARRAGDVPRSAEWSAWLMLLAGAGMLSEGAPRLFTAMQQLIQTAFRQAAHPLNNPFELTQTLLWLVLPVLLVLFVVALLAPLLLRGWIFVPDALRVDTARLRIFSALGRLGSVDAGFDAVLFLLKVVLFVGMAAWALNAGGWAAFMPQDISANVSYEVTWLGRGLLILIGWLALAAVLDAGWRWWRYRQRHAMTWQEVLAEAREGEVSPEIRARMRDRQQQAGARTKASSTTSPHPNPLPGGEGANVLPTAINEVIG
ncbi:MAG: EscU/YscU/HrcU family type III secretion system export apparatus switch protein [Thiobacillus sp.]